METGDVARESIEIAHVGIASATLAGIRRRARFAERIAAVRAGVCGRGGPTATGHIINGAIYMAAFGAGTLPMMLAIGLGGKLVPLSLRLKLRAAIPVSVFLLGALLILRGMSLAPYVSPNLHAGGSCCHQ